MMQLFRRSLTALLPINIVALMLSVVTAVTATALALGDLVDGPDLL